MTTIKLKFNKKLIISFLIAIIVILLAGGVGFKARQYFYNKEVTQNIIAGKEIARANFLKFLQQQELPPEMTVSIVDIIFEKGTYKLTINIKENVQGEIVEQESNIYLTKDGSLLFPQAINLEDLFAAQIPDQVPIQEFTQEQLTILAKCLTEKGVRLFGTYWCPACQSQKEMFKEVAKYLPYIECALEGNRQELAPICQQAGVTSFPDWRFPDGTQQEGMQTIEQLAELSGCVI